MATVSILIPAFKPDYLAKAIASALTQTFGDIEILVGDDNRDGRLRPIVESFGDARIRYLHNACGDTRLNSRRLWEASAGQYVKWLYDDDVLMPQSVAVLVDALRRHPESAMAFHERVVIDNEDNVTFAPPSIVPPGQLALIDRALLVENMVSMMNNFIGEPSNVMMVRDAIDMATVMSYRGWNITYLNDVSMYLNAAEHGPLVLVGGYHSCFRRHATQNSGTASPILAAGFFEWEVMVRGEASAGLMSADALARARNNLQGVYTYAIDKLGIRELAILRENLGELTQKPVASLYESPRFRDDTSSAWAQVQARLRVAA